MGTAQIKKLPVEHDVEDDDSLYPSRMPTSVRRYKPSQISSTPQPTQSLPSASSRFTSSATRSSQVGHSRSLSSNKKQKTMSEPDTYADEDIEDEVEPMTQAPGVPRRRASLESEQQQAASAMQAVRAPTGGLPSHGPKATSGTREANINSSNTSGTTRVPTATLRNPDPNAKAATEKASTTKIPSAALTGRLPDTDALPRLGRKPIVALLIGMVVAIILVMVFGAFSSWWRTYQDDIHYGRPRTYQIDAVVGHGDSAANPTHFIFLNLHRHVEIIEIDGGNPAHTHIYVGPVLFGDGQDLTPITGEIRDVNGDGKPDLIVHIQDQEIVYLNNGTIFVPQSTNP
jgi:hypothetical protein